VRQATAADLALIKSASHRYRERSRHYRAALSVDPRTHLFDLTEASER
jgi:hypothetical protein